MYFTFTPKQSVSPMQPEPFKSKSLGTMRFPLVATVLLSWSGYACCSLAQFWQRVQNARTLETFCLILKDEENDMFSDSRLNFSEKISNCKKSKKRSEEIEQTCTWKLKGSMDKPFDQRRVKEQQFWLAGRKREADKHVDSWHITSHWAQRKGVHKENMCSFWSLKIRCFGKAETNNKWDGTVSLTVLFLRWTASCFML